MRNGFKRPLVLSFLALVGYVFCSMPSVGGEPFPDGPAVTVGQASRGGSVAADAAGNFVIAWRAGGDYAEVLAQRVDATGALQGSPILVNETVDSVYYESTADVATPGGSDFVVVWGRRGRRFDSSGAPLTSQFTTGPSVNAYCWDDDCQLRPTVAGSSAGDFVVLWTGGYSFYGEGYPATTEAHNFDASGTSQGSVRLIGDACPAKASSVARNDAIELIVRDDCGSPLPLPDNIYIERFDLMGNSLGPEVIVNPGQPDAERGVVAMSSSGDSVVVWRGMDAGADHPEVFARLFDDELDAQGTRITVASLSVWPNDFVPLTDGRRVSVARNDTGDFVVVWTRSDNLDQSRLFGRRYHPDGSPDGEAFLIFEEPEHPEWWWMRGIDVAMDEDGNFMVVWRRSDPPGAFMTRRYCGPLRLSVPSALEVCEGQPAAIEVVAAGRRPFEYQWWRDGSALFDGGSVAGATAPLLQVDPVTLADAGSYDVEVLDSCATQTELLSQCIARGPDRSRRGLRARGRAVRGRHDPALHLA